MTDTNQLQEMLNKQVANWTVLYTKFHHFHWYVKGEHFFTLHVKFEELYNEAADYLDELAERLLAIGGKPVATLKESLEIATIQEAEYRDDSKAMVHEVVNDFELMIKDLKEGMTVAAKAGDDGTEDMLLSIQVSLEKHRWMLKSYLA